MTHIVDNIDSENKDLDSPEFHDTNSVLIQNCSDDQQFSQSVQVEPNYHFSRKDHKSFKPKININLQKEIPKHMSSIIEDDQNKEFQGIIKENIRIGPFKE